MSAVVQFVVAVLSQLLLLQKLEAVAVENDLKSITPARLRVDGDKPCPKSILVSLEVVSVDFRQAVRCRSQKALQVAGQ